jgi:hypothetical protein
VTKVAFAVCALAACGLAEVRRTERWLSPVSFDRPGALQLRTETHGAAIVVFATYPRRCLRDVVDIVVEGRAARRERAGNYTWSCPVVARDTRVHVQLPGGVVIDGTTDDRGELVYLVPSAR